MQHDTHDCADFGSAYGLTRATGEYDCDACAHDALDALMGTCIDDRADWGMR